MPYKDPDQQQAYQRAWMQARRVAYLADKSCESCGSTKNLLVCGGGRHRGFWSWNKERQDAVLDQAVILCRPCRYKRELV